MAVNCDSNICDEVYYTPENKLYEKRPTSCYKKPIKSSDGDFGNLPQCGYLFKGFGWIRKSLSMNNLASSEEETLNANQQTKRDTPGRINLPSSEKFCPLHGAAGPSVSRSNMLKLKKVKQFKATPVPKSVLKGTPNWPKVPKKPLTVPEPFKLTEVQKKILFFEPKKEIVKFKARPAPKHILEKPQISPRPRTFKQRRAKLDLKRAHSSERHKQVCAKCEELKENYPTDDIQGKNPSGSK